MPEEMREWRTPHGNTARFYFREGDTNDHAILDGILDHNEYGIRSDYEGFGVDVGAHIGGWTIAAAIDNPGMAVVAIEALYENVLLLQRNVRLNDLEKRVTVLHKAAASANRPTKIRYAFKGEGNQPQLHRYIGDMRVAEAVDWEIQTVPGLRLTRLLRMIGREVRIMKIDCEGCEWAFLRGAGLGKIQEIVGEYHSGSHGETGANLQEILGDGFHLDVQGDAGLGKFHALRK